MVCQHSSLDHARKMIYQSRMETGVYNRKVVHLGAGHDPAKIAGKCGLFVDYLPVNSDVDSGKNQCDLHLAPIGHLA